jgi:hypothetical protein
MSEKKTTTKLKLIKVIQEEVDAATVTVAGHQRGYENNIDRAKEDLGSIARMANETIAALDTIRKTPESTDLPLPILMMLTKTANLRARLRGIEEKFQENEKKKQ